MAKHLCQLFVLLIILTGFQALAIETPSLDLGKTLFESTDLGKSARSCSSCHPEGKGLDLIGDFNDSELKDIINACIRDALKGEMLSEGSQEMNSLHDYVRKLQED